MTIIKDLMAKRAELDAQAAELDRQIEEVRLSEIKDAIVRVKTIITEFKLSVNDVFDVPHIGKKRKASKSGSPVKAKFRDPASGKTWSGRGKNPKWLDGKDKAQFLIVSEPENITS
jgi:DNA-binding protein H-NS